MGTQPSDLVLRCYAHDKASGKWYAVCVDLNLAIEADTLEEIKTKMNDVIRTYLETVIDTDDKESIPYLLHRRAPINDWITYYFIKAINLIKKPHHNLVFQEAIPFHLAYNC